MAAITSQTRKLDDLPAAAQTAAITQIREAIRADEHAGWQRWETPELAHAHARTLGLSLSAANLARVLAW
jgi:hypothetical protein